MMEIIRCGLARAVHKLTEIDTLALENSASI